MFCDGAHAAGRAVKMSAMQVQPHASVQKARNACRLFSLDRRPAPSRVWTAPPHLLRLNLAFLTWLFRAIAQVGAFAPITPGREEHETAIPANSCFPRSPFCFLALSFLTFLAIPLLPGVSSPVSRHRPFPRLATPPRPRLLDVRAPPFSPLSHPPAPPPSASSSFALLACRRSLPRRSARPKSKRRARRPSSPSPRAASTMVPAFTVA